MKTENPSKGFKSEPKPEPEPELKPESKSEPKPEPTATKDARVHGLRNYNTGVNPKDRIGATKVDLSICSPIALAHWAFAQMDGVTKYGPYNWRKEPVLARTYIAAAQRHLLDYLDGQEYASDSNAHHLGHVMACCAILLDAEAQGTLVDDRPMQSYDWNSMSVVDLFEQMNQIIKEQKPEGWGR